MTEQEMKEWSLRMAEAEEEANCGISAGGPPFFDAQATRPDRNGANGAHDSKNGTPSGQPAKTPAPPRETP